MTKRRVYKETCEHFMGDVSSCKRRVTHDHPDGLGGAAPMCRKHSCPECKERPTMARDNYAKLSRPALIRELRTRDKLLRMGDARKDKDVESNDVFWKTKLDAVSANYERREKIILEEKEELQLENTRYKEEAKKLHNDLFEARDLRKELEERIKQESRRAAKALDVAEDAASSAAAIASVTRRVMDTLENDVSSIWKRVLGDGRAK